MFFLSRRVIFNFLLFLLVGSAFVVALSFVRKPDFLPIQSIKIEGDLHHISRHSIEQAILPYVLSSGFFSVDVMGVRNKLQTLPWVSMVSVSRIWPNSLVVRISEHIAVAKWGEDALLNPNGLVFNPDPNSFPNGLPHLDGPSGQQSFLLQQYEIMNNMLQSIGLHVVNLRLSNRRAWEIQLNNGMILLLGRVNPLERLQRFVKVYRKLFGGHDVLAERVDLRYPGGFAVKWQVNDTKEEIFHGKEGYR